MILTYAIKSALTLALLYLCMMPVLDKETFHRFNRIMVIVALLFSLVLPFVHIHRQSATTAAGRMMEVPAHLAVVISAHGADEDLGTLSWADVATGIYLLGVIGVMLVVGIQTIRLMLSLRHGVHFDDNQGNTIILQAGQVSPFCFFHYIVMSVSDYDHYRQFILTHEQEHIRLRHYVDLLVLAVATAVQWFNPFVWILGKELKAIHEYEADEAVINKGIDATQYQRFLVVKAVGHRLQLFANNLNRGSLKSRIVMMNHPRSSRWMMLKACAILPMALLAVGVLATVPAKTMEAAPVHATKQEASKASAAPDKTTEAENTKSEKVMESIPEFPGGQNALAAFLNRNVKYPEAALKANLQGKSVVSFVVKKDGSISNIEILHSAGSQLLDEEAKRVVSSMPRWTPGTQDGKPVDVRFSVPLIFRLDK